MANGIEMSKEVFNDLRDTDSKLDAIFDVLVSVHKHCKCRAETCNTRIEQLEKKKTRDTTLSAGMGVLGGFIAMVAKWIIAK